MSISMRLAIPAPAAATVAPPRLRVRPAGNGGSLPAARVALRTETVTVRHGGCASLPLKPQPLGAGAGQPSRRRGPAAVCHSSAHLSARTMQWISAGASAVLLLAKGTAINKSFLVPFFALQAPGSIISWINCLYLHLTIIGELELPLSTMLLVSVASYQLMNLRGVAPRPCQFFVGRFTGRQAGLNTIKYSMSEKPSDAATGDVRPEGIVSDEKVEGSDQNERDGMPSPQQEEAAIKKKYGGIMPRKTPLISKDHERAYFDSADWALGKQGGNPQKPKGPLEALRPKLQPTQQQTRSRRFLGGSADNEAISTRVHGNDHAPVRSS
ncbi:hypothetical protein C2845_PM06G02440 [Panicum miliaceum]|uniref:cAMP-regulated phosphoprotein 19-related protein n=1 Tax=Panicum miliaceum TaxID=4540 RepID=A0A3L6RE23_PANMI|nr:hypothetical protein C2845_PM06G02440 [Panicum miliaceum]